MTPAMSEVDHPDQQHEDREHLDRSTAKGRCSFHQVT